MISKKSLEKVFCSLQNVLSMSSIILHIFLGTLGVERTVVKKGRAPVDANCPIAKTSHVFEEDDDIWDCMLNQVCCTISYDVCCCQFYVQLFAFLSLIPSYRLYLKTEL